MSPISYNTDVNSLVFGYNTGGMNPYALGYNFPNNFTPYFMPVNIFQPFMPNGGMFTGFNSNIFSGFNNIFNSEMKNNNTFQFIDTNFNIFKLNKTDSVENKGKEKTKEKTSNKTETNVNNETEQKNNDTRENSYTTLQTNPNSEKIGTSFTNNALKYLGYNEADGSHRKFSNSKEWCADFVTYIVKDTYQKKGLNVPEGFGSHRVEEIKQWGIRNNKYLEVANKPNKGDLIAKNVKVGDILILRENGASHTGFVTKVNPDGTFETIEGNRSDKVGKATYSPNYNQISGFVKAV